MRRKSVSYAKYGYMFSLPFVLAFLVFSLYPLIYTVMIGFTDLRGLAKTTFTFLADPFLNYKTMLQTGSVQTLLVQYGHYLGRQLHSADPSRTSARRLVHEQAP